MKKLLFYAIQGHKDWATTKPLNKIPTHARKELLIFLSFLEMYKTYSEAMKQYKLIWINGLYELPAPNHKDYMTVKQGRWATLSRMKKITNKYLIPIDDHHWQ